MQNRVNVLGIPVDTVNMESAVQYVAERVDSARQQAVSSPSRIVAVNPEKIIAARKSPELQALISESELLIPDGIGVVLAIRLLFGNRLVRRVPGCELMPALCALAERRGYGVFLFGASEDANTGAAMELLRRYPALRIVGYQHGYVSDEDMPQVIDRINRGGTDILFVALGSPRQERWMASWSGQLKVAVAQGVGGTFDVLAGKVRRAPDLFCRLHLEWLYRLLSDPGRIRRQTALPKFAYGVLQKKVAG